MIARDETGMPPRYILNRLERRMSGDANGAPIKIEIMLIESPSDTEANWFNHFVSRVDQAGARLI